MYRRIVIQLDVYGRKLTEYPSVSDAARHVNGQPTNICKCCNGESPTAYGFKWRYKDDDESLISDSEYSMILERAYGEITNVIVDYKSRIKAKKADCLENGEKEPYHLRLVSDALENIAREFRERSDEYFARSKKGKEINPQGAENLANAIIERMALDYETALCEKDDGAIFELQDFARNKAYKYTNLDVDAVLERIASAHKAFKAKAQKNVIEINEMTKKFRTKRYAFSERNNPFRCPLCGGGMYVKTQMKSNSFLIGCTGCNLTEVVTIRS